VCRAFITSPFVSDVGVNGRVLIRLDERVKENVSSDGRIINSGLPILTTALR
jgi:hypothetical protein